MSNDRYYTAGTKEALFMLSRGYCYEPTCKERVMRWTGSEWRPRVAVAHICGLHKGSPRHDEHMTPRQRNNFKNLILLCKVHHDLVDGEHTWVNYSVVELIGWKAMREGDLADELDQLDWITQDKLQELMADAIEETLEVFEILPDHIPALRESARDLRDIPEASDILYQAARRLENVTDSADALLYASGQLVNLGEHAPQLLEAAKIINGESLWSYENGVRDINAAADKVKDSVASLAELAMAIGQAGEYAGQGVILTSPTERRSSRSFWWGFSTCMIFIIIVLVLWTYAHIHK